MYLLMKIFLSLSFVFLFSCSASYEQLGKESFNPPTTLSKYLMEAYKTKADFEAQEMHDWNSAKLYAEKALGAADGKNILPEKISDWVIPTDKQSELNTLIAADRQAFEMEMFKKRSDMEQELKILSKSPKNPFKPK